MSWVQQPATPFLQQQHQLQPTPQAQPNSVTEPPTADLHSKSAAPANKMRPQTQTYASNAYPSNVPPQPPHPQVHFGNQQHPQQQAWQQQQQQGIQTQPNQTMKSGNDWHLRQQQQPQLNNANMHQQYAPTAANNWQQPEVTAAPVPQQPQAPLAGYPNYYNQPTPTAGQAPQQQKPASYNHNSAATFFQPQQLQQPTDFFDNSVASSNSKGDGWGDWDWNDNNNMNAAAHQGQPPQLQDNFNANSAFDESFSSENWHWSVPKDSNANLDAGVNKEAPPLHQLPNAHAEGPPSFPPHEVPLLPVHAAEVNNVIAKPKTLPLPESTNDNYNIAASASVSSPSNIPNSVYVSQAKPVARPSRQYASPPGGSTPAEAPSESALMPPQAFQNEPPNMDSALPPPPAAVPTLMAAAPPPRAADNAAVNPFKRAGLPQHHRAALISTTPTAASAMPPELPPLVPTPAAFAVATPPPPPADFANPISHTNIEADNSEVLHENQEVLSHTTLPASSQAAHGPLHLDRNQHMQSTYPEASALPAGVQPVHHAPLIDERNRYMQTSQLSENPDEETIVESDNLPPPGLSRLVLGQPEAEASQRLVTGTEQPPNTSMHMEERHADGEDTSEELQLPTALMNPLQRVGIVSGNIGASNIAVPNIGLTTDRNLYLVPGESNAEPRVVTGVERVQEAIALSTSPILSTQRELELDGENLEDQQAIAVISRNEPPLEGAVSNSELAALPVAPEPVDHHHHQHHHQPKTKDAANASTESDNVPDHHGRYGNKSRKHGENVSKTEKVRKDKRRSGKHSESEETEEEYSSEREHAARRSYREGSARSDRGRDERELKEKRHRDRRDSSGGGEREKLRDKYYYRDRHENSKIERRAKHYNRHDNDTEESSRLELSRRDKARASGRGAPSDERGGRSDRSDRDYEDRHYYKRESGRDRGDRDRRVDDERDRRERDRRHRREREEYDTIERRRREKHRERGGDPRDYEEHRKPSSRNDVDKERRRTGEQRYDNWYGYPSGTYDPYTYYYEQMARTNPQAYSEWYKKYYNAAALAGQSSGGAADHLTNSSIAATDGRESVHSGRSSAHNEKDRYTHAYISQANEYHQRHYEYHYHQQQQQQQMSLSHMSFNSTMLEEANGSQYGGIGRTRSTSNLSQTHSTTSAAMTGHAYYAGAQRAYYARSEFADSRSGHLSARDADHIAPDPQRLTPCKFVNEHSVVSLSAGVIVTVKPKYTSHGSISNVVKIQRLGVNDTTRQLFQAFPGPLVRGQTHKKTIIEFCEEQIRLGPTQTTIFAKQLVPTNIEKYRASYTLMWNLLILLLRQNGMVVGTDIAELLLKNQQQFPYIWQTSNRHPSQSESDSPAGSVDESNSNNAEAEQEHESNEHSKADNGDSLASASKSLTVTEAEVTEKFRNYLLYGNVNEALDWATENNLWGHALFLASKMDRRSHANVMMKFANKLSLNDPLQTLYQLMSGRTPSSVTSVQDEKWGDWRPHLSMILSNTSQKPDLDRKAITTLGDSLFNRGDLFAAHFCYLMAQVGFGRYQESAVQETALQQNLPRLVLLGSSHYKTFHEFATSEAIIMTEIYEYACSLNDEKFSLSEFQPYKYLLATRLLDYGFPLRSFMYTEQIALHIQRDASKYESSFIQKIYIMADRLKYYDPVLEKTLDEQQQSIDGGASNNQNSFEEQKWLQDLRSITDQYKTSDNMLQDNSLTHYTMQNQIDLQFAEINQKFSELNMQYVGAAAETTLYHADSLQQQQTQHQHPQEQPTANDLGSYGQSQQPSLQPTAAAEYNHEQQQQSYGLPNVGMEAVSQQSADQSADAYANYGVPNQQQYLKPDLQHQQVSQNAYYDPTQQQQQPYNPNGMMGMPNAAGGNYDYWHGQQTTEQQHVGDEPKTQSESSKTKPKLSTTKFNNQPSNATKKNAANLRNTKASPLLARQFKSSLLERAKVQHNKNLHQMADAGALAKYQQKAIMENNLSKSPARQKPSYNELAAQNYRQYQAATTAPPTVLTQDTGRPTISLPKSKTYDSDDDTRRQQKQKNNDNRGQQQLGSIGADKDNTKSSQQNNQNSGWFGGIWNKLSLKPKNQMILPDDKNPSIVWDADKKRWVNTDGETAAEENLKPPPKMSDIVQQTQAAHIAQQQQQQQHHIQQQQQPQLPQQHPQMQQPPQQPQQPFGAIDNQQYVAAATTPPASMPHMNPGMPMQSYSAASASAASALPTESATTKPPSLQSNMFKMQRNRTLKNSYVDVFNPSGAPMNKAAENVLAPALPPAAVPQSGFFIPGAPAPSNDASIYPQQQQQQQPVMSQEVPQFYNPNQFGAGGPAY